MRESAPLAREVTFGVPIGSRVDADDEPARLA